MREKKLSVAFVGPKEVGKTSIIHMFLHRLFHSDYQPTIDDMYTVHTKGYCIEIFDTSGETENPERRLRNNAIDLCDVVVYVFSVASQTSLRDLHGIILNQKLRDRTLKPSILVGNKMDMPWSVSKQMLQIVQSDLNTNYMPVSSKDGINVDVLFKVITKVADKKEKNREIIIDPYQMTCCNIV